MIARPKFLNLALCIASNVLIDIFCSDFDPRRTALCKGTLNITVSSARDEDLGAIYAAHDLGKQSDDVWSVVLGALVKRIDDYVHFAEAHLRWNFDQELSYISK